MRVKITRCTLFLIWMMSLLLTVHLPAATFMRTTAHAHPGNTPVSLDNHPADASLRRQGEFSCANIQLLTFSVSYDDVGGKIRNTNDQPTRLTRTVVTWDESQLGDTLNPAVVEQRLYYPQTFADVIFWNGFDAVSPTDTSVAAEGSLLPGANLTINPGEDAIWRAYFANTSQLLYFYFWQQDFAGTTLYFDHPTSDEDCAMPVTFVTSPSFYVTTTEDTVDGTCDTAHCSLREAVLALNALSGLNLDRPPRIYVPAGEYRLTRTGVDNGSGHFDDLDVQRDVAIIGEDAETTIIDGMNMHRIFEVHCRSEVILRNFTIRNGRAGQGGGILACAIRLSVLHSRLTGNTTSDLSPGYGGAISVNNDSGFFITHTQIDNNSTPNNPQGGAVWIDSSSGRITDSVIRDNPSSGIAVADSVSRIINTTIRDNARAGIDNAYSDVYLYNSTISGNQAGISHFDNFLGTRVYIAQSTVVDNETGLVKNGPTANFSAINSIIADNIGSGGQPQNCGSGVVIDSDGYNLIEPVSGCRIRSSSNTDLFDVDPMLGALSDNGGVNETYLPQPGSPVIDMIPVADCLQEPDEGFFSFLPLLNDQRGIRRPQGAACDIGAVETEAPSSNPMVFRVQTSPATADGYLTEGERSGVSPTHFQVIFSRAMYNPPGNSSVNDITSPGQYRLIVGGADGIVQTTSCAAIQGDDVAVTINSVIFNATTVYATLAVNNGVPLANGAYRLFVCASAQDTNRLPLDGNRDGSGGDDFALSFTVGSAGSDYVVNSVDDVPDWYCGDWQGLCALRGAILLANSSPGTQTIYVPAGTYVLTQSGNEDQANLGDLDILDDVIIIGEDPATTIIDGNANGRIFHILNGARVELYNITLRNGGNVMEGGGILVDDGELTLSNTHILDNSALNRGGGIATGSALSQNVTITDSIIRDNQAPGGGGIYHSGSAGAFLIRGSSISRNTAGVGGGIYVSSAFMSIENSTISENRGITYNGSGGGLYVYIGTGEDGRVTITHSTIANNQSEGVGGGIDAPAVELDATILAGNTAALYPETGNCYRAGGDVSLFTNLAYGAECGGLPNLDPLLTPLTDAQGNIYAYDLQPGSPARDVIPVGECPTNSDQLGRGRPQGGSCDIGAVEASPASSVLDVPTELNAVALSPTSIGLSWTNNAPTADEIVIERSTDGGTNWTLLERIAASLSTYEDSAVVCETAYSYRVAAYRLSSDQLSEYSAAASITPACPPGLPVLLQPADGAQVSLSQPLLTWQAVQDAVRYEVELSAPGLAAGTHSVTAASYTPATPLLTTTYQWRVRAFNAGDAPSEWSAPRSFTILSSVRAVPVIHFYTTNTITLTWNRLT